MIERDRLARALATARGHLLAARTPGGFWEGRLSSSALSTATAVSAVSLAKQPGDAALVHGGLDWLARAQNSDGGWGDTTDSPSNLSTTLLSLAALHLGATETAHREAIALAEAYVTGLSGPDPADRVSAIKATYGADRTFAVPILVNCALAGLVPWTDIPGLPFELAALPQSWYRAVRLQVVSYALPALIAVGIVLHRRSPGAGAFSRLVRRLVERPVRAKLQALQPDSGGFLEATPLTAFVSMSLTEAYGATDPTVQECLAFLRASVRCDGSWPIDTNLAMWVTSSALNALRAGGGLPPSEAGNPEQWIAEGQYAHTHPYTGAHPGGWGWTRLSGAVPDADDTSGAVLALSAGPYRAQVDRGVQWLVQLQNADGGWPTFCRGWGKLPFDQSCPDVTAHALRALSAARGLAAGARVSVAMSRGLRYLRRSQRVDGSWLPLWFGNQHTPDKTSPVLGTARVVMALATLAPDGTETRRGVEYLVQSQNADGGFGGSAGAPASVEETALAVSALTLSPKASGRALDRGIAYLVRRVEDGTWVNPSPIGLYFASLWYSEQLYPVIWTVEALGRAHRLGATL